MAVRITMCDDPKLLPFAKSRLRALRGTGLNYASQKFTVDGSEVHVRKEREHEYISISGGGPDFWILSTFTHVEGPLVLERPYDHYVKPMSGLTTQIYQCSNYIGKGKGEAKFKLEGITSYSIYQKRYDGGVGAGMVLAGDTSILPGTYSVGGAVGMIAVSPGAAMFWTLPPDPALLAVEQSIVVDYMVAKKINEPNPWILDSPTGLTWFSDIGCTSHAAQNDDRGLHLPWGGSGWGVRALLDWRDNRRNVTHYNYPPGTAPADTSTGTFFRRTVLNAGVGERGELLYEVQQSSGSYPSGTPTVTTYVASATDVGVVAGTDTSTPIAVTSPFPVRATDYSNRELIRFPIKGSKYIWADGSWLSRRGIFIAAPNPPPLPAPNAELARTVHPIGYLMYLASTATPGTYEVFEATGSGYNTLKNTIVLKNIMGLTLKFYPGYS